MTYHRVIVTGFLSALTLLAFAGVAHAAITQLQQMTFGTWMVTNNTAQHAITVATNGSYVSSPALINMGIQPQPGIYQVDGLPPFTIVGSVDVTVNFDMQGSGPDFLLDNCTTAIPMTDGAGVTNLTIGCRARTSGTFTPYPNDTYNGELHIQVNL